MTKVSVTKALTNYFNEGEAKKPAQEWLKELRALTTEEKRDLAQQVCDLHGWELAD